MVWDTDKLRPEVRLLLCGLQVVITPATRMQLQELLAQPPDWNTLLAIAGWHGALPLLYLRLRREVPEQIPPRVMEQLQAQYHTNAMDHLVLVRELARLLERLAAAGVTAVPYKGPALALSLYGDGALRHSTDLDILVHPRDVLAAKAVLEASGYSQRPALNPGQERLHRQFNNVFHFFRPDGPAVLELHWAITPRYLATRLSLDDLWSRLEPVSVGGAPAYQLAPADLLLVLCIHGSKHSWENLKWIIDLARLIHTTPALNWGQVLAQAEATGHRRKLLLGLTLAHGLLAAEVPAWLLLECQRDPTVTGLAQQTVRRLDGPPYTQIIAFERAAFRWRAADTTTDQLRFGFDFLFSPDELDLTFLSLPSGLTFLYRPLRLVRLVGLYGVPRPQKFFQTWH